MFESFFLDDCRPMMTPDVPEMVKGCSGFTHFACNFCWADPWQDGKACPLGNPTCARNTLAKQKQLNGWKECNLTRHGMNNNNKALGTRFNSMSLSILF